MPDWNKYIAQRLRPLRLDPAREAFLIAELAQHVEQHYQDLLAEGVAEEDACKAALAGFADRDVLRDLRSHAEPGARAHSPWTAGVRGAQKSKARELVAEFLNLEGLAQDLRYSLRGLLRAPGFAAVAMLTIALGIGATTAIFSVVHATLLRPLPYSKPEQLFTVEDDLPGMGATDVGLSEPEWQDLEHSGIFEHVSPAWFDENNLTGSSRPSRVRLLIVAPNYFALLGVKPKLGRAFHPQDHSPGLTLEAVISDGLWKRDFGGDPNVLGRSIRLDTDLYRIVGIMPRGFDSPGRSGEERNIDVWISTSFYGAPLPDHPPRNRRNLPTAIARIKSGLTPAEAQSRLDALTASLQQQYPIDYPVQGAWRVRLVPLQQTVAGNVRQPLILLLAAVSLVLLIGCVNVANLLLARASARSREVAIRQAIGAAPARLARQLLTESLCLSLVGGMVGIAMLFSMKSLLLRMVPESLPQLNEISINWVVLLFAIAVSLTTGAIFGLAPAWQIGQLDLNHALRVEGRSLTFSREQARTRRLLVVTEFALSLVLLTCSGLLLRSFKDLLNQRLGFDPQNVMSVRTRLPDPNDPAVDKYPTPSKEALFLHELLRRARSLPGVSEVAAGDSASVPLDQSQRQLNLIADGHFFFTIEGRNIERDRTPVAERSRVTPEYFQLLRMPLVHGRLFNDSDNDQSQQVAVVNEAFAQTYWPNENPIGKAFKSTAARASWITVVGVVADARTNSIAESGVPQIYLSLYQSRAKRLAIFLRGQLDAGAIPEQMREQVQSLDPTLPVFAAQTLKQTVSASLAERRFSMEMVAWFALAALLLAALGIYGVISYLVNERAHEFGVRLALGADRRNILRLVLGQGLQLAIAGAAVGLAGALLVSHLMAGVLYGVKPTDPLTFVAVAALLLGIALLACLIPAWRATRADPMFALR